MAGGLGAVLGTTGQVSGLLGILPGPARAVQYSQNKLMPNALPDPASIINMYVSGIIPEKYYTMMMEMNGFGPELSMLLPQLSYQRPPVMDLINLWRRGKISKKFLDTEFERIGVTGYYKALFIEATEYFPPPPDLIRFAVREVYSPETVTKFGMDQDVPPEFLREAYKAGLPTAQALNYWKSHWTLPSASQGFEMFQRGVITQEELNLLLKSLDIMPLWRDKLTNIAYNVITRVDARRMYKTGVYNKERLKTAYLHMGYSPEDAEDLTEYTVRNENPEVEGLSRAAVIGAYKKDLLTIEELTEYLKQLNYSETVIQFWVAEADWEKTIDDYDIVLGEYQDQYLSGAITEADVRIALDRLDLHPASVDNIIEKLNKKKLRLRKIPSKNELIDWLKAGIIEENIFFQRMRLIGYSDEDTRNYMTMILLDRETVGRRFLDDEIYLGWYTKGILTLDELRKILEDKQYSTADVERLLNEAVGKHE